MPITQDRMIAIIATAQDYKQALDDLIERVQIAFASCQERQGEGAFNALWQLAATAKTSVVLSNPDSPTILALEARHFKKNKRSNERHKLARRMRSGTIDTTNAPATLNHSFIKDSLARQEPVSNEFRDPLAEAQIAEEQQDMDQFTLGEASPPPETIIADSAPASVLADEQRRRELDKLVERALGEDKA